MKRAILTCPLLFLWITLPGFAQQVSKDSIQALKNQEQVLELSKEVNQSKLSLAQKQQELNEKQAELDSKTQKAKASAEANRRAAAALTTDAQNRKLAAEAKLAARHAERDTRDARRAQQNVEKLQSEVSKLENQIAVQAQQLDGSDYRQADSNSPDSLTRANPQTGSLTTATKNDELQVPSVVQRNVRVDSLAGASPAQIAQQVVDATYRSYPQQHGQPSIIINNIIVPPDYGQAPLQKPAASQTIDPESYQAYQAWLRGNNIPQKGTGNPYLPAQDKEGPAYAATIPSEDRLTFRERFGERPARNSGLWVIPVGGVHASNFNADLKEGKYDGRTGWNAGLDFRARMKRFFIQPGLHYFSSSMRVTSEDSISNAPLLDGPRIHALKLPLLAGIYLTRAKGGFLRFNIKGGIAGNYIISVDKNNLAQFDRDNIEDFSYGLNAGFGLELGFITLDFSHEWGMSPLFKDSNQKNNILRGTIGFKL